MERDTPSKEAGPANKLIATYTEAPTGVTVNDTFTAWQKHEGCSTAKWRLDGHFKDTVAFVTKPTGICFLALSTSWTGWERWIRGHHFLPSVSPTYCWVLVSDFAWHTLQYCLWMWLPFKANYERERCMVIQLYASVNPSFLNYMIFACFCLIKKQKSKITDS